MSVGILPEKAPLLSWLRRLPLPEGVKAWLVDGSDRSVAQRTAGIAFLIRVASAAIILATQVLLARWMGRFEYGVYVYVWTWIVFLGLLFTFGLANAAQRFVAAYRTTDDLPRLRGFISASRWLCFGFAATVSALIAAGVLIAGERIPDHYEVPFLIACVAVPLYTINSIQDFVARSFNWTYLALLPLYVFLPLSVLGAMGLLYLAGGRPSAVYAATAVAAGLAAIGLVQALLLRLRLRHQFRGVKRAYDMRLWVATALGVFTVDGFNLLLNNVDILLLQAYVSPADIAIYFAATKTLALVNFIYFAVTTATAHRFSEYHVAGDTQKLKEFVADSVRWTFWPSLAAALGMLAIGKPFLSLFGPGFSDGYPLIFVLSVGFLIRASIGPAERLLNMVGQQKACAVAYACAFATSLALCVVLIPHFGLFGAAAATTCAILVESSLLFVIIKRRLGLHVFIIGGSR